MKFLTKLTLVIILVIVFLLDISNISNATLYGVQPLQIVTIVIQSDSTTAGGTNGAITGYFSRQSTKIPDTFVFSSNGIDTTNLQSATLTSSIGSAACSTAQCSFPAISGESVSVNSTSPALINGSFDWWRNNPGFRGYWWSYDLWDGTHYASPETGTCGSSSCDYPGGTYTDNWKLDGSGLTYTNGSFTLPFSYVYLTSSTVDKIGRVQSVTTNPIPNASSGIISFSSVDGPFDSSDDQLSSNPLGRQWTYGFTANFYGTTYFYPNQWTLTLTYGSTTPTSSPTPCGGCAPTPTPAGATPTPIPSGSTPSPAGSTPSPTPVATASPTPAPAPNTPPVAVISAPYTVVAGDDFLIDGLSSYDAEGPIASYSFSTGLANASGASTPSSLSLWYPQSAVGTRSLGLTVVDNRGASDSDSALITVLAPFVTARLAVTGTLKVNRKMTLDGTGSYTPTHYPIDMSTIYMTISPAGGQAASSIKLGGTLNGVLTTDFLVKESGIYRATITFSNSLGQTGSTTYDFTVAPDSPPAAEYSMITTVYRNPADSHSASTDIYDLSSSTDGDVIGESSWTIRFNSNHDFTANSIIVDASDPHVSLAALIPFAKFSDEIPISFTSTQMVLNIAQTFTRGGATIIITRTALNAFQIKTNHVGLYNVELSVPETFGQPTLPAFITAADYLTGNTNSKPILEKILNVDNRAPTVDFGP